MKYFNNVAANRVSISRRALKNKDGKAWDNAKGKAMVTHCPRGAAFTRMDAMNRTSEWLRIRDGIKNSLDAMVRDPLSLAPIYQETFAS